jgi:hypothetical protein
MWWARLTKKNIKHFYMHEGSLRRREVKRMENFYYACIYDALQDSRPPDEKIKDLNRFRAKTVKLHSQPLDAIMLDTAEHDKLKGENATIYHTLRRKKRQTGRAILQLQDENGCIQQAPEKIIQIFVTPTTEVRHTCGG